MTRGELLDVGSGFAERDAMRGTTTVILVDDHELARQGVRKLLGKDGSIEVLGKAECCCEAISLIAELRPQVGCLGHPAA